MQTFFDMLGIDADRATILDVRRAFRSRAKDLHPDRGARTERQIEALQRLTEAYTAIKTEEKLAAYRAELLGHAAEDMLAAAQSAAGGRSSSGRERRSAPREEQAPRPRPVRPTQARYFSDLDVMRFDLGQKPAVERLVVILPLYRKCPHATSVERGACSECSGRELALTGEIVTMILALTAEEIDCGEARRGFEVFAGHGGTVQFVFDPHGRTAPRFSDGEATHQFEAMHRFETGSRGAAGHAAHGPRFGTSAAGFGGIEDHPEIPASDKSAGAARTVEADVGGTGSPRRLVLSSNAIIGLFVTTVAVAVAIMSLF